MTASVKRLAQHWRSRRYWLIH